MTTVQIDEDVYNMLENFFIKQKLSFTDDELNRIICFFGDKYLKRYAREHRNENYKRDQELLKLTFTPRTTEEVNAIFENSPRFKDFSYDD